MTTKSICSIDCSYLTNHTNVTAPWKKTLGCEKIVILSHDGIQKHSAIIQHPPLCKIGETINGPRSGVIVEEYL